MRGGREPGDAGERASRLTARELRYVRHLAELQRRPGLRRLMLLGTRAGDGWALLFILPAALVVGGRRGVEAIALGVASGVLVALCVTALKYTVRRERPRDVLATIRPPDPHAFPSGHAAQSFSMLVAVTWLEPWLGLALLPFVLLVAASRIFFGLHYPSDVAAGIALGVIVASATLALARWTGWL